MSNEKISQFLGIQRLWIHLRKITHLIKITMKNWRESKASDGMPAMTKYEAKSSLWDHFMRKGINRKKRQKYFLHSLHR